MPEERKEFHVIANMEPGFDEEGNLEEISIMTDRPRKEMSPERNSCFKCQLRLDGCDAFKKLSGFGYYYDCKKFIKIMNKINKRTCLTCKHEPEWIEVNSFFDGNYFYGTCLKDKATGIDKKNEAFVYKRSSFPYEKLSNCNLWEANDE